jgi:cytochrome c biogenesis protein CcmG/thiol:disulfide interchange protein DsbE
MRINSFFSTLLIVFSILLLTYFYAQYEKNKYFSYNDSVNEQVLKTLPSFDSLGAINSAKVNSYDFLKGGNGLFVHIWGTWCAPCEKEMPEFLKYAKSLENTGVKFLLVAVNDDASKVKKFISRFDVPANVQFVLDNENVVMNLFGTMKVPETFLFDGQGKSINKFIGPQEWNQESYQSRLYFWLNLPKNEERKIETH